jgi:hypothetical protein
MRHELLHFCARCRDRWISELESSLHFTALSLSL